MPVESKTIDVGFYKNVRVQNSITPVLFSPVQHAYPDCGLDSPLSTAPCEFHVLPEESSSVKKSLIKIFMETLKLPRESNNFLYN